MMAQQQLQHLYWRAGFGPSPQQMAADISPRQAVQALVRASQAEASWADVVSPDLALQAVRPMPDLPPAPSGKPESMAAAQRQAQNQLIREAFYTMNTDWLRHMATSPAQLREKLTFFWHGHFACRVRRPEAAGQLLRTIRRLALGKFPDLLLAVSREPAMLQFLNNQQNRKQRPNENFARELLELFTLGRGRYTEADVKEAARAFTGWGYDGQNQFVFRERQHDAGPKTFLGRTGNFTGEDILRIILEQPAAAEFITTKLYRFFVNDTPDPARIGPLAQAFFRSGYDVQDLMKRLLSADWFYATPNVGSRIKSPIELLVGITRTLGLQLTSDRPLIGFQKALGQTLFQPPNVAGWPGGRNWIDSSSLLYRLRLPSVLLKNAAFSVALKEDENDLAPSLSGAERAFRPPLTATLDLAPFQALIAHTPPAQQPARLADVLLQVPLRPATLGLVAQAAAASPGQERLRTIVTGLLSTPEYQLM